MAFVIGNRIKVATGTTGTGTVTLSTTAEDGFQNFANGGIANSDVVRYTIEDGTDFEIGNGTYNSGTSTLTRTLLESSTGSLLNLSGDAIVFVTAAAEDLQLKDSSGNISVSGNITVTGTVDGRDVATDGTKLDGIETGATADQTKADIDALNIDADTVDGVHASALVSTSGDTMTGDLLVQSDIKSTSQIRATGWWNTNTGTTGSGLATEIGVSAGESYILSYNRDNSTYGDLNFAAVNFNFDEQGGTTTIEGNEIWHAGNDGPSSGLDADLLDGQHGGAYFRVDQNETVQSIFPASDSTYNLGATSTTGNHWLGVYANNMYAERYYNNNDRNDYMQYTNGTGLRFYFTLSEEFRMTEQGVFHANSNIVAYSTTISDERLKYDINKISNALDKVSELSGYTFKYKHRDRLSGGVIAQEVEKVLPEAVSEQDLPLQTDDGINYKTVNYNAIQGLLIEAVKELKIQVQDLKAEIEELKNGSSN